MERKAITQKKKTVEDLTKLIKKYPVVGIINLYKTPSFSLQKIKTSLGENAILKMSKKSLLSFALKNANLEKLEKQLEGQPALILTNMNPFKLSSFLRKNKSPAPAKVGDIPEKDINVFAGPTDLPPGPAISTLTKVKIPAKVEQGKIAIVKDAVVCKAGQEITPDITAALNLLKLKPMEIGIDLVAVYENGLIYERDILNVDEKQYLDNILKASQQAINLAMEIGYTTKQTIEILLKKAFLNAKTLGTEANILDKGIIEDLIAKAKKQAELIQEKVK